MKNTAIEWAEHTCNFFIGCTKVSEGCANCYMYRLENRYKRNPFVVRKTNWKMRESELRNLAPSTIFVNSMSDTYHKDISDEDVAAMFAIMAKYNQHTYIILTKRIERARDYFKDKQVPDNIWIGTSIESEKYIYRKEILVQINAKTRFISFEPLLGKISNLNLDGIQWVIVGGESAYTPRLMPEDYVNPIFDEAKKKGIAFFFKQWGNGMKKCQCHNSYGCRLYKGQVWNELPC